MSESDERSFSSHAAWMGVSVAFAALGRIFVCLDAELRVVHASWQLDEVLGEGASQAAVGLPIEQLLGAELFGASGALRQALQAGERREGWRATLRFGDGEGHLASVTVAPMAEARNNVPPGICDPRVAHIVVLRPAQEARGAAGVPTSCEGLVARSVAMSRIFQLIDKLQHNESTVLLTGESGTGKELVARAIHARSPRRAGPFVAVNCGALPRELLESEMFGYVRGAFTGAARDRQGRFEVASDGTLFLDEAADMPLPLQAKLLRVLQERTFERLGENRTRHTDARIVAASNADLRAAIGEGRFRQDLYYRLRVVPIEIPPLRDRPEDIEPLAEHLLARVGQRQGRTLQLSPDAARVLLGYSWPGNVRELENALEYAAAVGRGHTILPGDLPQEMRSSEPVRRSTVLSPDAGLAAAPNDGRAGNAPSLRRVLDEHGWRRADVAHALGISRTTLWRRMREAGLVR